MSGRAGAARGTATVGVVTAPDAAAPGPRADRAVAAALAATRGEPVDDPSRPARRAVHVIAAIRAHRPVPAPDPSAGEG